VVDEAGIVAHDAGQVRVHERISSSMSSDIAESSALPVSISACSSGPFEKSYAPDTDLRLTL